MFKVCHKNENPVVFWRFAVVHKLKYVSQPFLVLNETMGFFWCAVRIVSENLFYRDP